MAAKTLMHDELTGVTLLLEDDETTEIITVLLNGHEVVIPQDAQKELYMVADKLQSMMRFIKAAFAGQGNLTHTEAYGEFKKAALTFAEKSHHHER